MSLQGCYYDSMEDIFPTTYGGGCSTDSVTYSNFIKPFIDGSCRGCHNANRMDGNINLDGYMLVSQLADNGKLLGVLGHQTGYSPMPKNGTKVDNCTLNKFSAWVSSGKPQN
ncbi:MAG: hypothetical protein RL213_1832 [Bacteroidota bacterium]